MSNVPSEVLDFLDKAIESNDTKSALPDYKALVTKILAYGSLQAIVITANMQQFSFNSNPKSDKTKLIAYYFILACQIKYDLTGLKNNPQEWYMVRLNDYSTTKQKLNKATNDIVKELELNEFLYIN